MLVAVAERLSNLHFRWPWLALGGLLVQVALFSEAGFAATGRLAPAIYIVSTSAVLVAVWSSTHLILDRVDRGRYLVQPADPGCWQSSTVSEADVTAPLDLPAHVRAVSLPLLLVGPGSEVMAVTLFELWQNGQVTELASMGVVWIALMTAVSTLFHMLTRHRQLTA